MQPTHDPYHPQQPSHVANLGAVPVPLAPPYGDGMAMAMHAQPQPAVDPRARTAAIALAVSALLLLVGLISRAWFSTRGGHIGLLGIEECRGAVCRGMSFFDIPRAPAELKMFSTIGIVGSIAAIGFLVQAAVMLFRGEPHRVLMKWLNAAMGLAAFGCFSFFFHLAFGEMSRKLSISYAGVLAMAGIIAASVVVGVLVRPLARRA